MAGFSLYGTETALQWKSRCVVHSMFNVIDQEYVFLGKFKLFFLGGGAFI